MDADLSAHSGLGGGGEGELNGGGERVGERTLTVHRDDIHRLKLAGEGGRAAYGSEYREQQRQYNK